MLKIIKNLKQYQKLPQNEKIYVYLDEKAVQNTPKNYNNEKLVNLNEITNIFQYDKNILNYKFRETAAKKLIQVAEKLKKQGITIEIFELYRSLKKQTKEFNEIKKQIQEENPTLTQEEIWEKTTQFIADPSLTPPHCTGGAVDLRLLDKNGNPLDFGVEINSVSKKSYLNTKNISKTAQKNRNLLISTMLEAEFAPLATEWWHYSYGDLYWSAFYNQPALYNVINL